MESILQAWSLSQRRLRGLARHPLWIPVSLAQPLVYLLLYSAVFTKVARIPGFRGHSYVDFLAPGTVIVSSLFSGGWAGMHLINDLEAGVIDRFLVTPVSRGAIIAGRLLEEAMLALLQSLVVVLISLAIGARYPGGLLGVLVLLACGIGLATSFGALSITLALIVRRTDAVVSATQSAAAAARVRFLDLYAAQLDAGLDTRHHAFQSRRLGRYGGA